MASLIPGYEYDIFISYRQKDNKYDGWVTEFVDNLRKELEATFKEQVSVYFDINPSDYLLESYDVDDSLNNKLKCLVFIPIISRTYCDSKSFAWVHEFKSFVEQASKDQFGLKIKLPNGNVANRVLPVRIHDLDTADTKECESVLGGVLRGIEFIYKEAGIDKPLAPGDNETKNLNNTTYRIQIIKVAHSIKEIIQGMKAEPVHIEKEKEQPGELSEEIRENEQKAVKDKLTGKGKAKFIAAITVLALLIVAGIVAYPKIFKKEVKNIWKSPDQKLSVAVLPFQNLTGNDSLNYLEEVIQVNLINLLSNSSRYLKVQPQGAINSMLSGRRSDRNSPINEDMANKMSENLKDNIVIFGNFNRTGPSIRLYAQLYSTVTKEIVKPFVIDESLQRKDKAIDSLSTLVNNYLVSAKMWFELGYGVPGSSNYIPEAVRYYGAGVEAYGKDKSEAIKWFSKAWEIDSNLVSVALMIASSYEVLEMFDLSRKWTLRTYKRKEGLSQYDRLQAELRYAREFGTPQEEINICRQIMDNYPDNANVHYQSGIAYYTLQQYDKAIQELNMNLKFIKKSGKKPLTVGQYIYLGRAYHQTGQYKKEESLYKKAEQDFPDDISILSRQAILSFATGDSSLANSYIDRYKFFSKEKSKSEADISTGLAGIYSETGNPDRAETYYRQALNLDFGNPLRSYNLAFFLIDKNRDVNQGLELIDIILQPSPDNYDYLDIKGWGLHKSGKDQEALDLLKKSWDIRRKNAMYNHAAYLRLKEVEEAVARMK